MPDRKPRYVEIKDQLREMVRNGGLGGGARVPTEIELSRQFRTTRATVRHALSELEREHLIVRMGRKGTFVRMQPWERPLDRFRSSFEDLTQRGLQPVTEVLDMQVIPADASVRGPLLLAEGARVVHLRRLRRVEGEPFGLLEDWIPLELYQPLLGADLSHDSLYRIFEERTGRRIASGRQSVGLARLTREEARQLGVRVGDGALEMRAVCFSPLGEPLILGRYLFPGDKYCFAVTLPR